MMNISDLLSMFQKRSVFQRKPILQKRSKFRKGSVYQTEPINVDLNLNRRVFRLEIFENCRSFVSHFVAFKIYFQTVATNNPNFSKNKF